MVLLIAIGFIVAQPVELRAGETSDVAQAIAQQKQTVSGVVKDTNGELVIGASVAVKSTTNGTITDLDGRFHLVVDKNAILVISFIGYKTIEMPVIFGKPMNIILKEDSEVLDEVVVVGYGSMRKKDLTGSIVQIRPDRLSNENPGNVQDILRGTAGLNVGMDASAKGGGMLQIRGQRSLYQTDDDITKDTHNSPLIILDGMAFYGELSEINPDDIGQIDVLKDASAAAVYGAKAANGVIIITTKKGKVGKPTINVSANFGFNTKADYTEARSPNSYIRLYSDWKKADTYGLNENGEYVAYAAKDKSGNLLATPGYYDSLADAQRLYGLSESDWRNGETGDSWQEILGIRLGLKDAVLANYINGKTFDWYKNSFRTGFNQDYNASISGASDRMSYYLSIGYLNNEGAWRDDEYNAVRANMKISGKVNNWLEIGANVNFQDRSDGNITGADESILNSPYGNYQNEDGTLAQYAHGSTVRQGGNFDYWSSFKELERGYSVLNTIFNAKVTLPFGITYQFNASPRYQWYYNREFTSAAQPGTNPKECGVVRSWSKNFDWSLNNTVTWDYTFAKRHHVILTLVQEAEEMRYWSDKTTANNILPSDALGFHNTQNANRENTSISTSDTHQTADAMLARLFYSYNDRYMLTASIRRDGYSAFGSSNPHATFPSLAVAWSFTNEEFWKWGNILSTGKLRLSWGKNGNRALKDPYISLADLASGTGGYTEYQTVSGEAYNIKYLGISRMANPALRWEKTVSTNIGLDFGFLNDRITGAIDIYNMKTEDMIMNQPLPIFSGFGSIATNLGEVQNKGFELSLNSKNIKNRDFEWNTTLTLSHNKNEIKHLFYEYENVTDNQGQVIGTKEKDYSSSGWFIGHSIGEIWDYNVTGIWQANEYEEAAKVGQRPGDPKVENYYTEDDIINADGTRTAVYNEKDKQFLGQRTAPWNWSMRNEFTLWKNLSFSFNLYSRIGFKRSSTAYMNDENASSTMLHNFNRWEKEYWTPENPSNKYARIGAKGPTGLGAVNKWYNSSFVRLDNISVAYTLPQKWVSPAGINNLKVHASIRNVAVFGDDWEYGDPETGGFSNRIFTLGFNVTL